jgi:hypothetical protein
MRVAILVLFAFGLVQLQSFAQKTEAYKFYDFTIVVDYTHGLRLDDYKYVLPNAEGRDAGMKQNHLYFIRYHYQKDYQRVAKDTLAFPLTRQQMDSLFLLTKELFTIRLKTNTSKYKIPPPPPVNDGLSAHITMDLGFRGDTYQKTVGYPKGDEDFTKLDKYLKKIRTAYNTKQAGNRAASPQG